MCGLVALGHVSLSSVLDGSKSPKSQCANVISRRKTEATPSLGAARHESATSIPVRAWFSVLWQWLRRPLASWTKVPQWFRSDGQVLVRDPERLQLRPQAEP